MNRYENSLVTLGKIESEVTLVRSDVTKIKSDHQQFIARLIDVEIYCQNNSESFNDYAKTTDQKLEQITS